MEKEITETIFFVLFKTSSSNHDRMILKKGDRTLQNFFDWCKLEREAIEAKEGKPAIMHHFKIERY